MFSLVPKLCSEFLQRWENIYLIVFEPVSTASWTRPKTITWQPSDSSDYDPCERTRARDATWIHERTWWSQCCGRLVCVDYTVCCLFRSQERRPFLETKPAVVIINRDSFVTLIHVKCPSESPVQRILSNSWALEQFLRVTLDGRTVSKH